MRGSLHASDTALAGSTASRAVALTALGILAGCAHAAPRQLERTPPPHVLVIGLEQVALRTTAWVELHAWLAAAGRDAQTTGDAALDTPAREYGAALAEDDRDALLGRTARALEACDGEPCARRAVAGTPFEAPYLAALPGFLARHWTGRAASARAGVEIARAALAAEAVEPLVAKLAQDLAIEWPTPSPVVAVVSDAPEPGRAAPLRVLLGARGSCFARLPNDTDRMHDARVFECVFAYAALRLEESSALGAALRRELSARGIEDEMPRAWSALVVHAVATAAAGWEPRHSSRLRQSVSAVMPSVMQWLAREWPARMRGEPASELAKRYAALLSAPDASPVP